MKRRAVMYPTRMLTTTYRTKEKKMSSREKALYERLKRQYEDAIRERDTRTADAFRVALVIAEEEFPELVGKKPQRLLEAWKGGDE